MKVTCLVENTCLPDRTDLQPEHGLSLSILTGGRQTLFDTGISGKFIPNAVRLGVDIAQTDLAVISHHHYDHGGGLAAFLKANPGAMVYLRQSKTENFFFRIFGPLKEPIGIDGNLLKDHSDRFTLIDEFTEIVPGVFIITRIGRQHPSPKGNKYLFRVDGNTSRPDDFAHELVLVIKESAGLVVFSGCSHSGILNVMDAVVEHFPQQPIKALFGGLHLIGYPLFNGMAGSQQEVEKLAQALLQYPLEKTYTGHCTGLKGYRVLKGIMGDKLSYFATGAQVEI